MLISCGPFASFRIGDLLTFFPCLIIPGTGFLIHITDPYSSLDSDPEMIFFHPHRSSVFSNHFHFIPKMFRHGTCLVYNAISTQLVGVCSSMVQRITAVITSLYTNSMSVIPNPCEFRKSPVRCQKVLNWFYECSLSEACSVATR